MNNTRTCGCKGRRTCLICEKDYGIINKTSNTIKEKKSYLYCPFCNLAWPGWDFDLKQHPHHLGKSIQFPGIYVNLDFLTDEEEKSLINGIDSIPWDLSQSGRRKQNYGPKCNFKKRKLRLGTFNGFPKFSQFIQEKFKQVSILEGFQTIEQCSLEYDPGRGASIDPHIDDCWVWGERIVTVNLLSDSILTMTYNNNILKYNLNCVNMYPAILNKDGKISTRNTYYTLQTNLNNDNVIRIPMPRRSLLIMYGSARYEWEHQILREDIIERRICLAYREFTPPYLVHGEQFFEGEEIVKAASTFF